MTHPVRCSPTPPSLLRRVITRAFCGAAGVLAGLAATPSAAEAQTQVQGTVGLTAGFTDNVVSAPEYHPRRVPGPESDTFAEIRPGLALAYASRRAVFRLGYTFDATHYFKHNEADSYVNRADLTSLYVTSPTSQLTLGANAAQGRTNAFSMLQEPGANQVQLLPPAGLSFVQLGALEGFAKDLSPVVRGIQGLNFVVYRPYGVDVFAPTTYELTSILGAERSWQHDAVGAELRNTYARVEPFTGLDRVSHDLQQELLNALVGRWRHDIGRYFASELDAGVLEVMRAEDFGGRIWQPTGMAALRYAREEGQAELAYTHGAQLDPYLGQVFLTDQIMLRGAVPIGRDSGVAISGTNGFLQGRALDSDGNVGPPINVILLDVALSWTPVAGVVAAARYQRFQQLGEQAPLAAIPVIIRDTFLLTLTLTYPPDNPRLPPYRPPVRVDRTDEIGAPADLAPPPDERPFGPQEQGAPPQQHD